MGRSLRREDQSAGKGMSDSKNLGAASGEVFWRDPAKQPPPSGAKLLVLTSGGVAVISDWTDKSNFVAWSPLPKKNV